MRKLLLLVAVAVGLSVSVGCTSNDPGPAQQPAFTGQDPEHTDVQSGLNHYR